MIEIHLRVDNNEVVIKNYTVSYPFSLQTLQRNTDKIDWYLSLIKCKNIQGSFRIFYSKVFPTHNFLFKDKDSEKEIYGGKLINNKKRKAYTSSKNTVFDNLQEYIVFEKKLLLHVNEQEPSSYMNDRKTELPKFLIQNKDTISDSVHFWIEYDDTTRKLDNEDILLVLRLEYE